MYVYKMTISTEEEYSAELHVLQQCLAVIKYAITIPAGSKYITMIKHRVSYKNKAIGRTGRTTSRHWKKGEKNYKCKIITEQL